MQDDVSAAPMPHKRLPWNKGKLIGAKLGIDDWTDRYPWIVEGAVKNRQLTRKRRLGVSR